jgi:tetratricopeptide (TPR) repeat protein
MKKIGLFLTLLLAVAGSAAGQDEEIILDGKTVDLYNEALARVDTGDYKGAVDNLIEAIGRTPDARQLYMALIEPCFNTNQAALLKEQLKKAKTIFPADGEICYYLGTVYLDENNHAMAIREFTLAINIEKARKNKQETSKLSSYYMFRGNSYMKTERFSEAIVDYDNVIALGDEKGSLYANRGIAHFKTGKPLLACRDWRKAKSLGVSSVNQYITKYCK